MRMVVTDGGGTTNLTAPTTYQGGALVQHPTVTVMSESGEIQPIDVKIETNRYKETSRADVHGLYKSVTPPQENEEVVIHINDVKVFTGNIEEVNDKGDGTFTITAFDVIRQLIRARVESSFNEVSLEYLATYVATMTDAEIDIDLPNVTVSPDYDDTPGVIVLDQIAKWADAVWWVDPENVIHIKEADPEIHKFGPEFIEHDPSAGSKKMPYNRVMVEGASPASYSSTDTSKGGREAFHMLSKAPITSSAGEGKPVYYYQSNQIRTQDQADRVASAILKEFQRQRANGNVGIIGEGPPVRPLDVIEMPEELNNEQYLVSAIKHNFTNQDGLISDVNCGGLIDGQ